MARDRHTAIVVVGARVHNLKNITVSIPLNSLTVFTGVSGSGKSSLAFDTLYAEGQRRYIASLSAYARQFLERIDRPDVDDIQGICPALAIRQKTYTRNPRSTVGTVTEINDYLRLLYARLGTTYCHQCGRVVERDSPEKIASFLMSLPVGMRFYICMPLSLSNEAQVSTHGSNNSPERSSSSSIRSSSLAPKERLKVILPGLQQQGFVRLLIGSRLVDLSEAIQAFDENPVKEIHVVVDRLSVQSDMRKRLVDSLEVCGRESDGKIEILLLGGDSCDLGSLLRSDFPQIRWLRHPAGILAKFSEQFECQLCGITYQEPEPRLFSFNNPFGACPECQGFGNTIALDLALIIPDHSKTLTDGAIVPWSKPRYRGFQNRALQFAQREGIPIDVPWSELTENQRSRILKGKSGFPGIFGFFDYLEEKKYKMHVRIFISRYRRYTVCPACKGERLRREANDVLVSGKRIGEVMRMTIGDASNFCGQLTLNPTQITVAGGILQEIRHRLSLLLRVGLEYLTLDRLSSTLSGGESQRIQLASSLGSTLVGALYVLDEPSIGLHPRDSQRLIEILQNLKSLGNTVVVVEHDREIMRAADYIVDLGPRAGENGGRVVCEGDYQQVLANENSLTGRYLSGAAKIPTPLFRRKNNGRYLELIGVNKHNLKDLHVRIPLGLLVCITGVSGSGKSTLVHEVIHAAIGNAKAGKYDPSDSYRSIRGYELISDAILVDQSPLGKTPRSNPVTYIKAFDDVREIFAETRDAVARNLGPGHFSFNLSGGRCETCQGSGTITVEMQFLADVELTCDDCRGKRFKNLVLEVKHKGKNIAEVLELTVHEALQFFTGHARLIKKLRVLEEIGLGYLRLGQSASSLSGGEAQRVKLAGYISRHNTTNTLLIFDEPTTGLHFDDIRKLMSAFDKLIDAGNSLVVIEHNLDVIKSADWIIDLGPEGGAAGGQIVFQGPADMILRCDTSYTGQHLRRYLNA